MVFKETVQESKNPTHVTKVAARDHQGSILDGTAGIATCRLLLTCCFIHMAFNKLFHIYLFGQKHGYGAEKVYEQWTEILKGGHDPNEDWGLRDQARTSPLFSAVLDNEVETAKLLLQYGAKIEKHNLEGCTALQEAIVRSHNDIIQLFLDHGTDLEVQVTSEHLEGGTALHIAVVEGLVDVVESLLERGANPEARLRDGWTAVDIAILDRQETVLKTLLKYVDVQAIVLEHTGSAETCDVSADGDIPSIIACHLIEHGVRDAKSKHRNLFLECLNGVTQEQRFDAVGETIVANTLIQETDRMLMEIAGSPDELSWPRHLCSQCERFQSQEGYTAFRIFEHSPNFDVLLDSAQRGCTLCHFIAESLNHRWCLLHQISRNWIEEFGISPQVRLRLEREDVRKFPRDYRLVIVSGEKVAFIDLDHVQSMFGLRSCLTQN